MTPARLLLAVLCAAAAMGQESPLFVESIEVRVVSVDVVVTDAKGNPLTGLTRDDFELLENGKRVDVSHFARISEGRLEHDGPAGAAAGAAEAEQAAHNPVIWAVYVDQTNIKFGKRNQALRELRRFLDQTMREGDRAIVATYDGQVFRVRTGVTADRAFLTKTLQTLEKDRFHMGPAASQEIWLRRDLENVVDPVEEGPALGRAVNMIVDGEAIRTRDAIRGMGSLLDVIAGADARTAIVYVGAGFNLLPGLAITETFRRRLPMWAEGLNAPRPEDRKFELEKEMSNLATRISATRATVYSIHAGDTGMGLLEVEDGGSFESTGGVVGEGSHLTEMGSVREIAERTGGRAFRAGPNLAAELAIVATDLNHYYSLGYTPKGEPGQTRDVDVRVKVPGARVRHREAVRERSAAEAASDAVVTALFNPAEVNPLAVRVQTEPKRGRMLPVRVQVPLDSLTFLPQGDVQRAGLVFHFALAAKDGSVYRLDSRELPLAVHRADFAKALTQHVSYSVSVPLQGAGARLAVSVQDRIGMTRSLVTVPLDAQ